MTVQRRRGGVQIDTLPALNAVHGLDYDYLYSADTLWRLQRASSARILPALQALCGKSLFFTSADATEFCSYVLPELGSKLNIVDPERLLLNQIPPARPRRACCGTPAPSAGPTGCWPLGWSRTPPSRDSTWSRTKSRCTACWKRACPP